MALNTHTANVFLPGCFGPVRREVVLIEDAEAELDALREALSEIIVKVQESRSETRRLNWIEGRAQSALEGKPWVKGVFQMPDPKNGKPKEERLSRQLAALREELAERNAAIELKQRDLIEAQTAVTGWAAKCKAAEQRNAALADALLKIIEMNRQHAKDQYGDPSKAESWACIRVARAALKPTESGVSDADRKADDDALQRRHDQERQEYFNDESGASE